MEKLICRRCGKTFNGALVHFIKGCAWFLGEKK